MDIMTIARIAHEANRALCEAMGDTSQPSWDDAPEWQRQSVRDGVLFHLMHPHATPAESHDNWMQLKIADGWRHGETKDPERRTHPCLVPFDRLPQAQRAKDHLFRAIVRGLEPLMR